MLSIFICYIYIYERKSNKIVYNIGRGINNNNVGNFVLIQLTKLYVFIEKNQTMLYS
jgi:hypothetical protein